MKDKSSDNYKAGEVLVEKDLFAPSIHCFYYSCIQFMIYILHKKFGKSDSDINKEFRSYGKKYKKGFHEWIINRFFRLLGKVNEVGEDLYKLKTIRVKADYKSIPIDKDEALLAKEISEKTINYLKEKFLSWNQ